MFLMSNLKQIDDVKTGDLIIMTSDYYFSPRQRVRATMPQIFLYLEKIYTSIGDYYRVYTLSGAFLLHGSDDVKILARFCEADNV